MECAQVRISFAMNNKGLFPIFLIFAAGAIWTTDAIVRFPAAGAVDPWLLVLLEHIVGLFFILPIVMIRHSSELSRIGRREILPMVLLGVCGSSLGGILYTESFQELGPSLPTLLQMIQPLFVVGLAHIFLNERGSATFFQCAIWVVFNAVLLGAAGDGTSLDLPNPDHFGGGLAFGLSAVLLWALSTVAAKSLLFRFSPAVVVLMRFMVATIFMSGMVIAKGIEVPWAKLMTPEVFLPILFLGSVAGSLSMLIYYHGMRRLPVNLVTFIELIYPVGGTLGPVLWAGHSLTPLQALGCLSLVSGLIFLVSSEYQVAPRATVAPQPIR